ncbi:GNAT family N-acetyltransferase [Nitratireductor luteus]|uniref:GNAT family N-acetyltransferase n=1 Tax=Nitratireductor luteus TaxID=2976980 RepID=UPI0022400378|nr:GNAT family N-acetyltransferase [Nitratireductor luteus]
MSGKEPRFAVGEAVLRAARPEDRDDILRIQDAAFPGDALAMSREGFADVLREKGTRLLVAETGERVAGYCLLRHREWRPWAGVDFLCVDAAFSGKGLGGMLLRGACDCTARPIIRLFVRPGNERARALYTRLGFRQTGVRKANYHDGEDAIIMMKWLGLFRQ